MLFFKMGFSCFSQKRREITLPMDLVTEEILPRLPVKTLMRFKCVSKLWSFLIRSRYFSNRYLTVSSRPRPCLYLCLVDLRSREYVILSLAPDTTTQSSFVVVHDLTISQMGGSIIQNLHGFMCYTFPKNQLRILNPATKQLIVLPAIILPDVLGVSHKFVSYFLGYDPLNDQYKLVCLTTICSNLVNDIRSKHCVFVLTFTFGGGSWKKVALDFCPHIPVRQGLCIDGVIYYMASLGFCSYVLVSFHIRSEEFKTIQLPRKDGYEMHQTLKNLSLIDYGGKLTLLDQTNLSDKGMLDLWVLEDAANMEWSRKTLVLQPSQLHLVNYITFKVKGTTQNGKVLMIPEHLTSRFHILCYDLHSNDLRKIEIKGIPDHWFYKNKKTISLDSMFMDKSESVMHLET